MERSAASPSSERSASSAVQDRRSRRVLVETLVVMALTLVPSLIWPQTKSLLAFLPIVYVLVERYLSKRPWRELGFRRQNFRQALVANWHLFLLVAVVSQTATVVVAHLFWPALLEHIQARIPLLDVGSLVPFLVLLPFAVLGEELVYRGMLQERLNWFMGTAPAILLASLVFALMHWTPGDASVVAWDLSLIVVDSILYGAIFARGKNIWVAWLAHWAADVVGLVLLLLL